MLQTSSAFCLLATVVLLFAYLPECSPEDCCSEQATDARLSKCVNITVGELNYGTSERLQSEICSNECWLACYEDSIKDCLNVGDYRLIDIYANRVLTRYACNNTQGFINADKNCEKSLLSWSCFDSLVTVYNVTMHFFSRFGGDFAVTDAYVKSFCSAARHFTSCAAVTPIIPDGDCGITEARILQDYLEVHFSLRTCGIKQSHRLFKEYAGPPNGTTCQTGTTCDSGGIKVMPELNMLLLAMLVFILLLY